MSINSGMWTAIVAAIDFSLVRRSPPSHSPSSAMTGTDANAQIAWNSANLAFTLCEYPLAALYANMALANLNARRYLRENGGGLSNEAAFGQSAASGGSGRGTGPIPLHHMNQSATLAPNGVSLHVTPGHMVADGWACCRTRSRFASTRPSPPRATWTPWRTAR